MKWEETIKNEILVEIQSILINIKDEDKNTLNYIFNIIKKYSIEYSYNQLLKVVTNNEINLSRSERYIYNRVIEIYNTIFKQFENVNY